jgi:transketolase
MRKQLCEALVSRSKSPSMIFLTGDLGFMALEDLRDALGDRFINAGVAEQNMMSIAAAMSKQQLEVWVYSIAPFCYARPFEQIRNDICFHDLPVKIIGNGGGYGYGVMGPTHHAIEDYGVLLTLPMMSAYIPVFDEDLYEVISKVGADLHPAYLRLGRGDSPKDFLIPEYAAWRQLTSGQGKVVLAVGPIAGSYITSFNQLPDSVRPNFWAVAELPISHNPPPKELQDQINRETELIAIEEHVSQGGFGSQLALYMLDYTMRPKSFTHFYAKSHTFNYYGSQTFLRQQSSLDVETVLAAVISPKST